MAQATDYNLANQSGANFRSELNTILAAVVSQNSGSSAPTTTYAYQLWIDTGASPNPLLKIRNAANSAWITIGDVTLANLGLAALSGATFTGDVTLNAQSDLRFADSDSSNWVAFQGPATVGTNVTWTLPATDGTAGQVMKTDGSGTLAWASYAGLASAQTFTAEQTFTEIKETVYTLGTSGTIALDPANGSIQSSVLTGAPTFTDSLAAGQTIVLHLEGGTTYTVTWPTITWVTGSGNAAPTLTAKDTLVLWKISTTLYGAYVGSYV